MIAAIVLAGVVGTMPAAGPDKLPRSNPIARAKIMSQNELSITIRHSKFGEKTAYRWAEAHCAKLGRLAVPVNSAGRIGDVTTTWRCE